MEDLRSSTMNRTLFYILAVIMLSALIISGCSQSGLDISNPGNEFSPSKQVGEPPGEGLVPQAEESDQNVRKDVPGFSQESEPILPIDLDPSQWKAFVDEEWSFQLLIPNDWTYNEIDLDNPMGPTFEFWKREVMFMPVTMAKIIAERSGPPGPDDPPTYPSIILDVTLGSEEEYRILHVEPESVETIQINGLNVDVENRYGQFCYVIRSASNPDLIVTLTDSINGFPQRMEGNEDLLAQIEMVISSFEFIGEHAPVSPAIDTENPIDEDVLDEQEEEIESDPESAPPALVEGQVDEYAPLENAFYRDDFSNEDWYVKKHADYGFYYYDGGYRIYNNVYGGVIWSIRKFEHWNLIVQAQAHLVDGPDSGYYGVVCRYKDEDNYYAFVVGENGFFGIIRRLEGEHSFLKKGYLDEASRQKPGERREVAGECIDDNLKLYLDGELLAEVYDKSFDSGYIGIVVGTSNHPGVEVEFSKFEAGKP
jgi:hypothetical protein